jgi:hypothetical protein
MMMVLEDFVNLGFLDAQGAQLENFYFLKSVVNIVCYSQILNFWCYTYCINRRKFSFNFPNYFSFDYYLNCKIGCGRRNSAGRWTVRMHGPFNCYPSTFSTASY